MLVGTFNQEKALVGAFSMIVKLQTSCRFVSSSTSYSRIVNGAGTQSCLNKVRSLSNHNCFQPLLMETF